MVAKDVRAAAHVHAHVHVGPGLRAPLPPGPSGAARTAKPARAAEEREVVEAELRAARAAAAPGPGLRAPLPPGLSGEASMASMAKRARAAEERLEVVEAELRAMQEAQQEADAPPAAQQEVFFTPRASTPRTCAREERACEERACEGGGSAHTFFTRTPRTPPAAQPLGAQEQQEEAFLASVWRRAHASKLGQLTPVTVELDAPGKLGIILESLGQVRCPEFSPVGHPKFRTQN